jgi:hypothetical protein
LFQTNPEKFVVLTSGEEAPKEGGLRPGGEGRSTDPEKDGQMDQEVQRLPRRAPRRVPKLLLLGRREGVRSQESGVRSQETGDRSQETGERRHRAWGMEHRVVIADVGCEMWDWAWGLARKGQGEKSGKGKNLSQTERKDVGG